MMKLFKKTILSLFSLAVLLLIAFYILKAPKYYPKDMDKELPKNFFGVTYSKKYAIDLGLDWREVYQKIINDLQVKYVRIPVYWDDIEKNEGEFDFDDYLFMVEEGEREGVEFILSFGMRVPRWPECHIPEWIDTEDVGLLQEKTMLMIEEVVSAFNHFESIAYFQVENEPLLNTFGICPRANYSFLKKEIERVREMSDKSIIISATGELSFWSREIELADVFGTTMYRIVHNPYLGYIKYPYGPGLYRSKANALKLDLNKAFIVEVQAEPWVSMEDILDKSSQEYLKSFSLEQFKANLRFAVNTDFYRAYLWGVEWWYLRELMGDSSYLDLARDIF